MSAAYFWKDNEVFILDKSYMTATMHELGLKGLFCIDTEHAVDDPIMRYGMYTQNGWHPVSLDKFPKEFRVQLLLMGVS